MDRVAGQMAGTSVEAETAAAPLEEALVRIGTAAHRGVLGAHAVSVLRLCLGEQSRFPELARVVWDHGPAITYANFRAFLTERRERGEIDVEDLQFAAEQFLAGIVGHIQLKVAMGVAPVPDDDEIAARVTSAVQTFLARYGTGQRAAADSRTSRSEAN
jgi:hypothetical protein